MHKITLNATELVQPDVDLVSMVKRGANRIPFRITKKDDSDMLDLSKIGADLFQKNDTAHAPTIVGAVFAKGADVQAHVDQLKTAGIDVSTFVKAEGTGTTTLTKADTEVAADKLMLLKMSDEVALVVTGPEDLMKSVALHDWDSTSFKEIMKKGTFVPSVMLAQDMLTSTFFNILEKAESSDQLATLMTKAATDFGSYVAKLTKALPESVFKAEVALTKMSDDKKGKKYKSKDEDDKGDKDPTQKSEEACPEGHVQIGTKKSDGADVPNYVPVADAVQKADGTFILKTEAFTAHDGTIMSKEEISNAPAINSKTSDTEVPKDGKKDGDIEGNPAAGNGTPTNPPTKNNGPGGAVSSDLEGAPALLDTSTSQPALKAEPKVDPVLAAIAKMQQDMTASMAKGLSDMQAHVDQSVATMKGEVQGLTGKVEKAEAALGGTVVGDAAGDQTGTVRKSAGSSVPPLLDTAVTPISKLERDMNNAKAA